MARVRSVENLYETVVAVTDDYLGPASERFVSRQIRNHLDKEPHELTVKDLPQLIKWIKATISVITEDVHMIKSYISDLEALQTSCKGKA